MLPRKMLSRVPTVAGCTRSLIQSCCPAILQQVACVAPFFSISSETLRYTSHRCNRDARLKVPRMTSAAPAPVPLLRHGFQVLPDLVHRPRIEFKQLLPAGPDTVHNVDAFQHAKVLRDGLPGERGTRAQLSDRTGSAAAQLSHQSQPRLISQRRKKQRRRLSPRQSAATTSAQHGSRYSSSVRPSLRRSSAMLRRAGRLECSRSRTP